jgi:hypothetical protein
MDAILAMDEQLITSDENPYRSPQAAVSAPDDRAAAQYPSAKKAFLAGAWRGAKFGGKWMGLILGGILIVESVAMIGVKAYFTFRWPGRNPPLDLLELLKLIGISILAFVYCTSITAVISAIMMGIGEVGYYWRAKKRAETTNIT